jgi:hypothetical protein
MPAQDYEEFIAVLNVHGVRYLVIGAYAVALDTYGAPAVQSQLVGHLTSS